jgi:hypothetical protein
MAFRAVYLTRSRSHRVYVATDGNTGKGLTMMTVTVITDRTLPDAEDGQVFCHAFNTDHIMMDETHIYLLSSLKNLKVERTAISQMVITTEGG